MARHVNLVADHVVGSEQQVAHSDILFDSVRRTVQPALAVAREVQGGLAQGLAEDGAGVDANATRDGFALDDRHTLAELGTLDGRALSGRPGADHHQIVLEVRHVDLQCNCANPATIELQAAKQSPDTTYGSPSRADSSRSL